MRIKIYDFLIDLLLIIGTGIPLIFGWVLDTWRTILTIAIIFVTLIYIVTHTIRKSEINHFLLFYILGVIGIVTYEVVKGGKAFDYSAYETFYALRQYLWIILAVPLYYVIIKGNEFDRYLKQIVQIVLFSLGLRTVTWFCKNYLGITVFYNLLYEYGNSWGRNSIQRIDATALIGVLIPVLYYLYRKYNNRKYLWALGFVFTYLMLVSQTRTLILGSVVCIISMVFFEKRKSTNKLILQLSLLVAFAIAINMGALDFLLNKMNITINDGSIGYRWYEFSYYSSLLQNGKWKTGIGIITTLNSNGNRLMFGNLDTPMYLDDLGIFECFVQFGLLSIFLYGALLFYMIYVLIKCKKAQKYDFILYLIGQLCYVAIVSLPLNLFGIQRIFSVPIILAIVCAIHYSINREGKRT